MSEYMDVISWKKTKNGKPFAVRIGSAKTLDNGNINIYFDALPIPTAEGCQVTVAPRREKGEYQPSSSEIRNEVASMRRELNDDPF